MGVGGRFLSATTALPLGVDVGSNRVCVAVMRRERDGAIRVEAIASRTMPAALAKPGETAAAISDAVAETGSRLRMCVLSIPARDAAVRRVNFPTMSSAERKRAAWFEASRFAVWDIEKIATTVRTSPIGTDDQYVVGAVPLSAVRRRVELARLCRLRPLAIDFEPFAAQRCFAGCDAVLDVGTVESRLYACNAANLGIALADAGGDALTAALQVELAIDRIQAERRKRSVGMAGAGEAALDELVARIRAAVEHLRAKVRIETVGLIGNGWRVRSFCERLCSAASVKIGHACRFSKDGDGTESSDVADWILAASLAAWPA